MFGRKALASLSISAVATVTFPGMAFGQYNERPHLAGSGQPGLDCSGRSIKNKRVRAVHTEDPTLAGGTAYFLEKDPYLAYQLGRNLNFREFRERDGIFDALISNLKGPMPDGTTAKITANNQTSCVGCHNLPQGNPGGGANFHKDAGKGRNSPHYYGGGIVEMLALQVRADMLLQLDTNRDGWVSANEANARGNHIYVTPAVGLAPIDYGNPSLSGGATGSPSFNNIFKVWYVDSQGQVVTGATEIDGITTFGYNFEMIVWGWGQGRGRAALNPTNRAFLWDPYKTHGGLDSHDPTTNVDANNDGISEASLPGAIQFPVSHSTSDKGVNTDRLGFSRDDPDQDGFLTEISEGDLDLAEWFMLNAPRPAFAGTTVEYLRGVLAMHSMKCTDCHVPNWTINAKDAVFDGDRRFFDLDVRWHPSNKRLEGKVVDLTTRRGDSYIRNLGSYKVVGIFSDLRHHDMGEESEEIDFGGNINRLWRTPPLWGVGSGFPWMHDGHSLTLDDAILRHGGDGAESRRLWNQAPKALRKIVNDFLQKLQLYDIEDLPTDIDGDGVISQNFMVAGMDTGEERFNPEWLFKVPLRIQGPFVNTDGVQVTSFAGMNVDDAYGQLLPLRQDQDDDGWPDVWDYAPTVTGYKDGVN